MALKKYLILGNFLLLASTKLPASTCFPYVHVSAYLPQKLVTIYKDRLFFKWTIYLSLRIYILDCALNFSYRNALILHFKEKVLYKLEKYLVINWVTATIQSCRF